MSQSILYYPTIDIKDSTWLRSAVLYWDEICSIVPYKEFDDFSPEIMYLQECGMYRPLYSDDILGQSDIEELISRIEQWVESELKRRYYRRKKSNPIPNVYNSQLETLIHCSKIPETARDLFIKNNIAINQKDDWLAMDESSAISYMCLLAEFAVKYDQKDMIFGTDREQCIPQMYPRTMSRQRHREENDTVVSLILDRCLPIPAHDISFETILDFKEHRKYELLELRNKIRELEKKISDSESSEQMKSVIAQFRESWEKELFSNEKMFKDAKIGWLLGSIRSFIVDAGGASALIQSAEAGGFLNVPGFVTGAIIGTAGLIGVGACKMDYKRKIRDVHSQNGFAYLVSAKKEGILSNSCVERF